MKVPQFILEKDVEEWKKRGLLGPITLKIAGEERKYLINPEVIQKVINANGKCPCKPHDRCHCEAFLKYGICICTLYVEIVKDKKERIEKVKRAKEYWKRQQMQTQN